MTQSVKMTRVVNTTANSFGFGRKVLIRPGANEIDLAAWGAVADMPFVKPFLKSGELVVEGEIEFENEGETSSPARRKGRPKKA